MEPVGEEHGAYESRMIELVGTPLIELTGNQREFYDRMLHSIFVSDFDQEGQDRYWNLGDHEPYRVMRERRCGKTRMIHTLISRMFSIVLNVKITVLAFIPSRLFETEFAGLLNSTQECRSFCHRTSFDERRILIANGERTSELLYTRYIERDSVFPYYEYVCAPPTGMLDGRTFCSRFVIEYLDGTFRFGSDMEWLRNLMVSEDISQILTILRVDYLKSIGNIPKSANNRVKPPDETS